MDKLLKLRAKKNTLVSEADALSTKIDAATTDEERATLTQQFDAKMAEVEKVAADIAREEKLVAARRAAVAVGVGAGDDDKNQGGDDDGDGSRSEGSLSAGGGSSVKGGDPVNKTDGGFASLGHFVQNLAALKREKTATPIMRAWLQTAEKLSAASGLNMSSTSDGGILVPPTFEKKIWDEVGNRMLVDLVSMCDRYPVEGESLTLPKVDVSTFASGSVAGGIIAYWLKEGNQLTSTKPQFDGVKLEPHEIAVLVYITNKLLKNSPIALGEFIVRKAAEAIQWKFNNAIINGTGSGQPLGILASPARVTVSAESGQDPDTIWSQNIYNMWPRIFASSKPRCGWFINSGAWTQLPALSQTVGVGGVPIWLPPNGMADTPFSRLFGRPVYEVDWCPALGDEGDIILADLQGYAVGLRNALEIAQSGHLRFDYLEEAIRVVAEMDGRPWLDTTVSPANGSLTQSYFVTLAAR